MKKYIITALKKRGLNETGEANILDLFKIFEFIFSILLIPFFAFGFIMLLELLTTIFKIF